MIRSIVADLLGALGDASPAVISALVTALTDSDYKVQLSAVDALFQLGNTSSVVTATLIKVFQSGLSSTAQSNAAVVLGKWGKADSEIVESLVRSLQPDNHESWRRCAAEALAEFNESSPEILDMSRTKIVKTLVETLQTEDYFVVRNHAAKVLGRFGNTSSEAIKALIKAFQTDSSNPQSFIALCNMAGNLSEPNPEVVEILITASQKGNGFAVDALGKLWKPSRKVIEFLIESLEFDRKAELRESAARALGNLGKANLAVTTALMTTLRTAKEYRVCVAAANALFELGETSSQVNTTLIKALQSCEDDWLRDNAARILGKAGLKNQLAEDEVFSITKILLQEINNDDFVLNSGFAISLFQISKANNRKIFKKYTATDFLFVLVNDGFISFAKIFKRVFSHF